MRFELTADYTSADPRGDLYWVTGRFESDDDDTTYIIQAINADEAIDVFKDQLVIDRENYANVFVSSYGQIGTYIP